MEQNSYSGSLIIKGLIALQAISSLMMFVIGIYYGEWYAALGFLLFPVSIISGLPFFFPPEKSESLNVTPLSLDTRENHKTSLTTADRLAG